MAIKMSWKNILKALNAREIAEVEEFAPQEMNVKYYTKDGKEWTGPKHQMPDGSWMTENPHNEKSVKLTLKGE